MPNPMIPIAASLFLVLTTMRPGQSQPTEPLGYTEAFDAVSAVARHFLADEHVPGMSIAITDRYSTLKILTFGVTNVATGIPVTERTLFGVGSITKSMVSTALLELLDEGRFDPYKPVVKYLPSFYVTTSYAPINGRDLLTHSSGMPSGSRADLNGPYLVYALREVHTGFAPGSHFAYSNNGYHVLGRMLERLDGRRYVDVIADRVLRPLEMTESEPASTYQNRARAATGYVYAQDDRPSSAAYPLVEATFNEGDGPSGSVFSTPADMAKYLRFLLGDGMAPHARLLTPRSFKLLTKAAIVADGAFAGFSYSYGLAVRSVDGHETVSHMGRTRSYTSCMQADLDGGLGAIVMTNLSGEVASSPCVVAKYAIAALRAVDAGMSLPALPPATDLQNVENAADFAGNFESRDRRSLRICAAENRLVLVHGSVPEPLYPRGDDAFWVDDARFGLYLLHFARDTSKHVTTLSYGPETYRKGASPSGIEPRDPESWASLTGHYRAGEVEWGANFRIFARDHRLWIQTPYDGSEEAVTPIGKNEFRVGNQAWSPERLRFDTVIDGKALRAIVSGEPYYRTFTP